MFKTIVGCFIGLLVAVLVTMGDNSLAVANTVRGEDEAAEPAPPSDQTYTGSKRCSSCHFKQYMAWKKTTHAKTFDLLPDEYKTNEKCLKCHTTGYGEPSGFTDVESTPNLVGTTCETCHGPGSKHEEVSQSYAKTKELPPEAERAIRDSIWMMLPRNICVECHMVQGHHESETPDELRPE